MASTTRTFGLILIALGLASYFLTDRVSVTALIPAFFGAVFVILALVARHESARKHAMHAAVALGLLGFLGTLRVIRQWAGLRVLTPDGAPIYYESRSHRGIYVVACHSGVTLPEKTIGGTVGKVSDTPGVSRIHSPSRSPLRCNA